MSGRTIKNLSGDLPLVDTDKLFTFLLCLERNRYHQNAAFVVLDSSKMTLILVDVLSNRSENCINFLTLERIK